MKRPNAAALFESARVGADALRANPLRTVLSTTGVIIGVAALVAAFAITDGVAVWSRALVMRESSVQDVAVTPLTSRVVDGRTVPVRGVPLLSVDDAERARAEIPGVHRHVLMINGGATVAYLDRRLPIRLTVSTASLSDYAAIELAAGRFFTRAEEARSAPVIVLGNRLARELAGNRDALWLVGRAVRVGEQRREVIGVLAPPPVGGDPDLVAFAPLRGGVELLEPTATPRTPTLRLKAHSIEAVDTLRIAVLDWLAERYGRRVDRFALEVGSQRLENVKQGILLSKLLLGALVALILAVGGIGIMNVLLAAVVERTREIGIRKAVGARASDIQTQFLVESVIVTGAGSLIGFIAGVVLAEVGTAVFRLWAGAPIYPVVRAPTALLAAASAIAVGVLFGTYPARRAARLSPVDAMGRE